MQQEQVSTGPAASPAPVHGAFAPFGDNTAMGKRIALSICQCVSWSEPGPETCQTDIEVVKKGSPAPLCRHVPAFPELYAVPGETFTFLLKTAFQLPEI